METLFESDMQRITQVTQIWGKSHLMPSHGLDESLHLCWNISVTEQIQAGGVGNGCLKSFTQVEELKEMCTYEVLAPGLAMLKLLYIDP